MSELKESKWPAGFIPGVGRVPGGPRIAQILPGSVAVMPANALSSNIQPKPGPDIKREPIEGLFFPPIRPSIEPKLNTQTGLPEEELLGPIDTVNVQDFGSDYLNDFVHQLNMYNRQSRTSRNKSAYYSRDSDGESAIRQSVGPSVRLRSRGRSRSPDRFTSSAERQSSPFFLSERSTSRGTSSLSRSTPEIKIEREEVKRHHRCQCPISVDRPHRRSNHLDCRPLVLERISWRERRDQEAYDRERAAVSFGENFTDTATIIRIVAIIDRFEAAQSTQTRTNAVDRMHDWIVNMEDVTITPGEQQSAVTTQILPRFNSFLNPETRQQRHSAGLSSFIEEELTVLRNKWGRGDFNGSIRRGLLATETLDVNNQHLWTIYRADTEWEFFRDARVFGDNGLVNGQLFTSRAELRRDGVHAPPVAGISGTIKGGAYSIVMGEFNEKTNKGYADIDMGNVIEYMGTALPDEEGLGDTNEADAHMHIPGAWDTSPHARKPTAATRAMMRSIETGTPVRVIRSCKMCDIVTNKPNRGYRYDGLYRVVGKSALKEVRQIWSFRLERLPDQGRLRGFRKDEPPRNSNGYRRAHFY